jgi:hypothetical protein
MSEILPPTTLPPALPFSEFLTSLFQAFGREGLRPCVLRNYEGFPAANIGTDVDFLIRRSELPLVIRALRDLHGTRIVGYAERHYVAHVFVEGVSPNPGIRALELDFIWSLNWKGLEYLATEDVIRTAIPRQTGDLTFLVPSPAHEAITSLLSSLLIGGWLKEKYFPKVQETFVSNNLAIKAVLSPKFGNRVAAQLVDSVIAGDRPSILSCVKPLRTSLVWSSLLHNPLRNTWSAGHYHLCEFAVRCTPATLETVCVSGLDLRAAETIVASLVPMLRNSAKIAERRHFGPRFLPQHQTLRDKSVTESDEEYRTKRQASMAGIFKWAAEELISRFAKKENLTIRFDESSYYGLLCDSQKRCFGGPRWLARVVGWLLPSIDLLIVLGEKTGAMQPEGDHTRPDVAPGPHWGASDFVKSRKRCVISNACPPSQKEVEEAYSMIIDTLVQRTDRRLKNRF